MNLIGVTDTTKRRIGYARVSTYDQFLDLQTHALDKFGCDEIFYDEGVSGGIHPLERKGFKAALLSLNDGDILAVWKLDRLGRTLKGVIDTVDGLKNDNIQFVSLTENIDTTTATGRAFWQFIGLMAELERGLIRERTIEGMAAARRRGVHIGRPRKLTNKIVLLAHQQITQGQTNIAAIAQQYDVSTSTVRRALAKL
ncbi:MAG: hypothetical protein COA43_04855 [Robiginitomaculum sp.]|nr:MAG: hypothetical protein COA43_04855 [Robiginitomaculum sp.]